MRSAPARASAASDQTLGTRVLIRGSLPYTGGITTGHVYQVVLPRPEACFFVDLNRVGIARRTVVKIVGFWTAPERNRGLGCRPFILTYQLRLPCSLRICIALFRSQSLPCLLNESTADPATRSARENDP